MSHGTSIAIALAAAVTLSLGQASCTGQIAGAQRQSPQGSQRYDPLGGSYPQFLWMVNVFEADAPLQFGATGAIEQGERGGRRTMAYAPGAVDGVLARARDLPGYRHVAVPSLFTKPGQLGFIEPGTPDKAHASVGRLRIEVQASFQGNDLLELYASVRDGDEDASNGMRATRREIAVGGAFAMILPSPTADRVSVVVVRPSVLRSVEDYPFQTSVELPGTPEPVAP